MASDQTVESGTSGENSNGAKSTAIIHSGNPSNNWTHSPLMAPIYQSTTFETLEPGKADYEYSRCDNPTRAELERYLKTLEGAKYGLAFSSGLGALTVACYLLESGQHVLCCDDVYGGTNRFFSKCSTRMGIETTFVDGISLNNWSENFKLGKTKMVWIETPTNPTMKIVDIKEIVIMVKKLDPNCVIVVDNTFMTPVFQSPLKLGADIVMHSCTKYINGHSDVIMGALMTNDDKLYEKLKFFQNALGIVPSAFDCSQVIRSVKTLHVRVKRQADSAMKVAKYLEGHKYVERVLYPGLKSHPQHELAMKQCSGFSGIISIYVKNINNNEGVRIVQAVKVFLVAVSLGCVCSLIEVPSLMTHSGLSRELKDQLGLTDNLLRLSIGLEDPEDLIADLEQAFKAVY